MPICMLIGWFGTDLVGSVDFPLAFILTLKFYTVMPTEERTDEAVGECVIEVVFIGSEGK